MNNVFNVNWNRFVLFILPKALQKQLVISLINSCVLPLKTNHSMFLNFKKEANYKVKHTGQIVYLQKMLNDKYDTYLRRIKLENITPKQTLLGYYVEDSKPVFAYTMENAIPVFVYNTIDYYNEFDFKVIIPTTLSAFKSQMKTQINYYKLFSKKYEILEG